MAMPAYEYARAALDAEAHVQLEIDRVELPSSTPGEAVVHGKVARVFRGDTSLLGASISFEVSCLHEEDDAPPSGVLWTRVVDLKKARVMEAYLDHHEGAWHVALYNSQILDALTDAPQLVFTEEEAREPERTGTWDAGTVLGLLGGALFIGLGFAGFGYALWTLFR
jgi:hypothetical protein